MSTQRRERTDQFLDLAPHRSPVVFLSRAQDALSLRRDDDGTWWAVVGGLASRNSDEAQRWRGWS